ncbi:MAG: hypothetical protein KBC15_01000 [Candidatus Levybacteria bacterium]|nr:hypothetical protein [Candidatus Levybacteria bacterium]
MERELPEVLITPKSRRDVLKNTLGALVSSKIDGGIAGAVIRGLSEPVLTKVHENSDLSTHEQSVELYDDLPKSPPDEGLAPVENVPEGISLLQALLEEARDGLEIEPIRVVQAIGQVFSDREIRYVAHNSDMYANQIVPIGTSRIYFSHAYSTDNALGQNASIEFIPDGEFEGSATSAQYDRFGSDRINHHILDKAKITVVRELGDDDNDDYAALRNAGFSRVDHVPFLTAAIEALTLGEKSTFAPEMIEACDFLSMQDCALDWYENTFMPALEQQEDLRPTDIPIEPEIAFARTHFLNALNTRAAMLSASPSFDADAPEIGPNQDFDQLIDKIEQEFGLASRIGNALPVIGTAIEAGRAILDAAIPAENLELATQDMLNTDGEEHVLFESTSDMKELGQGS